jgi:mitochondrial distribution and morphology protein 12
VHSFTFGTACPEVEIKDISDPLPDFYEDDASDDDSSQDEDHNGGQGSNWPGRGATTTSHIRNPLNELHSPTTSIAQEFRDHFERGQGRAVPAQDSTEALPRSGPPGIPGGTSNFSYFHHLPLGGLSGTQTPLAAVASGTPFSQAGWHYDLPQSSQLGLDPAYQPSQASNIRLHSTLDMHDPSTRPSTATTLLTSPDPDPTSNPSSPEHLPFGYQRAEKVSDDPSTEMRASSPPTLRLHPSQPSDMQVVARVQYSGDLQITLTAEILLDYPMPSFVGIPLKLSITGITFDGVAILAYIKKRMHFCFLDPEDAQTLVGDHVTEEQKQARYSAHKLHQDADGLIKEIRIESEIGRQESGKQVLKNVGKVEKFVLEQIRRIFEEEFVFPSFWTFLV